MKKLLVVLVAGVALAVVACSGNNSSASGNASEPVASAPSAAPAVSIHPANASGAMHEEASAAMHEEASTAAHANNAASSAH